MGLMIRMCLLLEQFLALLCDESAVKKEQRSAIFAFLIIFFFRISEITIEDLGESTKSNFQPNAQTRNFHALLNWVRDELLTFHSADTNLMNNMKMLNGMLYHLVNFRLGLPRFFFQRVQHTRIKANIFMYNFVIFPLFSVNHQSTANRRKERLQGLLCRTFAPHR